MIINYFNFKWFPESKGKANSVILFGLGAGGILFNIIQTDYVNPKNLSPDSLYSNRTLDKYTFNPSLIKKMFIYFQIRLKYYNLK